VAPPRARALGPMPPPHCMQPVPGFTTPTFAPSSTGKQRARWPPQPHRPPLAAVAGPPSLPQQTPQLPLPPRKQFIPAPQQHPQCPSQPFFSPSPNPNPNPSPSSSPRPSTSSLSSLARVCCKGMRKTGRHFSRLPLQQQQLPLLVASPSRPKPPPAAQLYSNSSGSSNNKLLAQPWRVQQQVQVRCTQSLLSQPPLRPSQIPPTRAPHPPATTSPPPLLQ
jgi:hypothetical protein